MDPTPPRGEVMAHLMNENENAEDNGEGQDGTKEFGQRMHDGTLLGRFGGPAPERVHG